MKRIIAVVASAGVLLSGCGANEEAKHDEYAHMNHDSEATPTDMKVAQNPKYKKGDKAEMTANHMDGMKGAEASIDDVHKTDVYVVDYKDIKTGKTVKDYKWMTEDELK